MFFNLDFNYLHIQFAGHAPLLYCMFKPGSPIKSQYFCALWSSLMVTGVYEAVAVQVTLANTYGVLGVHALAHSTTPYWYCSRHIVECSGVEWCEEGGREEGDWEVRDRFQIKMGGWGR